MTNKKIPISLDEAKKLMVKVLVDFDKICREHNLRYWLTSGSLLGAVRHQGFIPWDDDIDIAMPKSDYDKLIDLDFPDYFFFQNRYTDKHYSYNYGKLRFKNSLFIEKSEIDKEIKYHQGIFIDIFPIRFVDSEKYKSYKRIHYLIVGLTTERRFYSKFLGKRLVLWAALYLDRFHKESNDLAIFPYGNPSEKLHPTLKSSIFPLKMQEFENRKFPVPNDCHAALISFYGHDYMTLPSKDKRRDHHDEIFLLKE